jgi:hypothetical protein
MLPRSITGSLTEITRSFNDKADELANDIKPLGSRQRRGRRIVAWSMRRARWMSRVGFASRLSARADQPSLRRPPTTTPVTTPLRHDRQDAAPTAGAARGARVVLLCPHGRIDLPRQQHHEHRRQPARRPEGWRPGLRRCLRPFVARCGRPHVCQRDPGGWWPQPAARAPGRRRTNVARGRLPRHVRACEPGRTSCAGADPRAAPPPPRYLYFSTSDVGDTDFAAEPAVLWRDINYAPKAKIDLVKDLELEIPEVRRGRHRRWRSQTGL